MGHRAGGGDLEVGTRGNDLVTGVEGNGAGRAPAALLRHRMRVGRDLFDDRVVGNGARLGTAGKGGGGRTVAHDQHGPLDVEDDAQSLGDGSAHGGGGGIGNRRSGGVEPEFVGDVVDGVGEGGGAGEAVFLGGGSGGGHQGTNGGRQRGDDVFDGRPFPQHNLQEHRFANAIEATSSSQELP